MAMTKDEAAYLGAGVITKNQTRLLAIKAQYKTWLDAQDTEATAIQALLGSMNRSRNPNFVLEKADALYAAVETDAPNITSIVPNTGLASGGTAVEIHGTDFTGATVVTLGGTTFTSKVVVSDILITAVSPAKTAGPYDVVVTTPAGSDTLAGGFTTA